MKYRISLILAGLILVALAGIYIIAYEPVKASPEDQENRSMVTFDMVFHPVTDQYSEIYNADVTAYERFESALKDQLPIRPQIIDSYRIIENRMGRLFDYLYEKVKCPANTAELAAREEAVSDEPDYETYPKYGYKRLSSFGPQQYSLVKLGDLYNINSNGWLVTAPLTSVPMYKVGSGLYQSVEQMETILEVYPDIKIYNYFVSGANHTPWFDEYLGVATVDAYEYITRFLPEEIEFAQLDFKDLEDYQRLYFKTDHHWNYKGSEYGYRQVYAMMEDDMNLPPLREPLREWNFSDLYGVEYRGSRARMLSKRIYNEYDEFIVYEYDLGDRKTFAVDPATMEEIPVTLTLMDQYKTGDINKKRHFDHYIRFYGRSFDAMGAEYSDSQFLYKIVNPNSSVNENLLIVGDSTQRAYRDVLASHFDITIYLDYRILQATCQGKNNAYIDHIIEKYDISAILIGGLHSSFWYSTEYKFTFSPDFDK